MSFPASTATTWIRGSYTAIVTPFSGGAVDEKAMEALIERQIAAGTNGLVAVGTTGESATLSIDEHIAVVRRMVEMTGGRIPVLAGVGSNDTPTAVVLAEAAAAAGADGLLAVTGYYNRPPQAGLIAHYQVLADATDLPIVLYNVPARTASDLEVATVATLSRHDRIVGIKDATANLGRVARHRLCTPDEFIQLSGEDITAVGFNAMGGTGCISVTANVAPAECAQMQAACLEGRWDDALALQDRLAPLHDALFADASPAPVKYALARLGLIKEELRLPLVPASEGAKIAVDAALASLDLI